MSQVASSAAKAQLQEEDIAPGRVPGVETGPPLAALFQGQISENQQFPSSESPQVITGYCSKTPEQCGHQGDTNHRNRYYSRGPEGRGPGGQKVGSFLIMCSIMALKLVIGKHPLPGTASGQLSTGNDTFSAAGAAGEHVLIC